MPGPPSAKQRQGRKKGSSLARPIRSKKARQQFERFSKTAREQGEVGGAERLFDAVIRAILRPRHGKD
jgi:hypothetical protein